MSVTKDGFYNIEGKMFEVVHGVEGDCLILGDEDGGTRISGPKPWGGGQVTKTFVTQEKYGPIERLEEENAKLQEERDEWHRVAVSKQDIIDHMRDSRCENAKLREAVATAIKVQAVLCGDADSLYCRNKCPLHRPESNDCLACDVIGVTQELGIEVMDG